MVETVRPEMSLGVAQWLADMLEDEYPIEDIESWENYPDVMVRVMQIRLALQAEGVWSVPI